MHQLKKQISSLADVLKSSINLLVVDDYPSMRSAIVELFSSPLFNICTASSAEEARICIAQKKIWHSWVLDISLEEKYSGINLLAEYPQYPFAVILSGLRSMRVASRAMELGAFKVYDKDPQLLPVLHSDVCKLAALSFILNGAGTKYLPLFSLLSQGTIDSADTWASNACITVRQLERICSIHSHLTPRFIIPLYYTLNLLLQIDKSHEISDVTIISDDKLSGYKNYIDFVFRNITTIIAS
ncbi:MAG: response regulator [Chitinispirillaceae bacterium]|nr:response regulator [Chitinispirillaceae bacterium]